MAIFDRIAVRAVHRSRSRVDRFKLTKKPFIRQLLLADDAIGEAVKEHSAETSVSEAETWKRVEDYIDEIVPFFNILTYYKIGMVVSRMLLNFFQSFFRLDSDAVRGEKRTAQSVGPCVHPLRPNYASGFRNRRERRLLPEHLH